MYMNALHLLCIKLPVFVVLSRVMRRVELDLHLTTADVEVRLLRPSRERAAMASSLARAYTVADGLRS